MSAPRKRVRERPEVRRARIVDEAIRIVGKYGYYGFTVQALAESCELTNAGLLHYFGSKDGLLLALLDEIERREEAVVAPAVADAMEKSTQSADRSYAVMTVMEAITRRTAENRELTRFLTVLHGETIEPSHPAHDWFRQREIETVDLFTRLLGQDGKESLATTRFLISILRGLTAQWLRDESDFDLTDQCMAATRLLLKAE